MSTLYEILDVPPEATSEQLKAAYRILVQLHHPDRLLQSNPAVRAYAEERLKKINQAYDILSDPERRAKYDAQQLKTRATPAEYGPADDDADGFDWQPRAAPRRRASTATRQAYEDFAREAEDRQAEARVKERQRRAEAERRETEDRARQAAQAAYPRLRAETEKIWIDLAPNLPLALARLPAGEFRMGSDLALDPQAGRDDQPQHSVYVSEFYLGRHPVTRGQYLAFTQAAHYQPAGGSPWEATLGGDDWPVVNVSWDDALAFCQWLSKSTGRPFRLPTEAEWEKAARGTDARLYPWGNEWDPARLNSEGGPGGPTPPGQYSPAGDSPYGLADLAGNVWEWCGDWYDPKLYARRGRGLPRNPQGPADGQGFVVRGGAFDASARQARCAHRNWHYPDRRKPNLGFRLCLGV